MFARIFFIKNNITNVLYIGSTSRDINERFKEHKRDIDKYPTFKLYKAMKEYNADNFYILLIEELEVDDIKDLRRKEGQYIKLITPALHKNIAGRDITPISNR
jgi:group I intron endonuclease